MRTLVSTQSKYDSYIKGEIPFDESEERGRQLFFSDRSNCSNCHSGILFSNQDFINNGTKDTYLDQGRKLITAKESDRGKFKVPSLRNVAITSPYMHDGSFNTLQEVIEHYNKGGSNHPNKNKLIRPLNLNDQEKEDLIAFLSTLSDQKYLSSN